MLPFKILIFELLTLQYLGILEDVDFNLKKISFSLESTPNLVAYGSWNNKSIIKISKCNFQFKNKFRLLFPSEFKSRRS